MSATMARHKVMVLNRNWVPVSIATLQRAITLLFSEHVNGEPKARIVDASDQFRLYTWDDWSKLRPAEGEAFITGYRDRFKVPELVLLSQYDKMPQQTVRFSRRQIYRRDDYTCQYCNSRPGSEELTIDHIMPKSRGGLTTWENCVLACWKCNMRKADKTPEEARLKLLRKPHKPKHSLLKGDRSHVLESWKNFMTVDDIASLAYWNVELENDERK